MYGYIVTIYSNNHTLLLFIDILRNDELDLVGDSFKIRFKSCMISLLLKSAVSLILIK